jgi:hypothetical protein
MKAALVSVNLLRNRHVVTGGGGGNVVCHSSGGY